MCILLISTFGYTVTPGVSSIGRKIRIRLQDLYLQTLRLALSRLAGIGYC